MKQPPLDTSGILYSTVNLTCRAVGSPMPSILWYKNDNLIQNGNNDPSVLLFSELVLHHRGFYHCQARNIINGKFYSVNSSVVLLSISSRHVFITFWILIILTYRCCTV